MKLSRRASLLILPVILISYTLTAIGIYGNLRDSVTEYEQSRLDNRLSELRSSFSFYVTFLDAYQVTLMEGDVLSAYLQDSNNFYREKSLTSNLSSAINRLRHKNPEFVSVSLIDKSGKVLFYVENSTDPFSTIRPQQIQLASRMFEERKLEGWEHIFTSTGESFIQQSQAIDIRTMAPPLASQLNNSIQLIIATIPARFDSLLQEMKEEYTGTADLGPAVIKDESQPNGLLSGETTLKNGYHLYFAAAPGYLAIKLFKLQQWIIAGVLIASLVTFLVLQLLIRRYVIKPIADLDTQLNEVISNQRDNIDPPTGDDEVTRLGHKFYTLYEDLNEVYKNTRRASLTDALTQLPNRTAFYDKALKQCSLAQQQKETVSFIYIDLDNFKFVNDKYGHEIGDELLKAVATRLKHLLEISHPKVADSPPVISRLSGDEFVVMLPRLDGDAAVDVANKILGVFARGYHFELGRFPVTASLGIASFPEDGHTLSQLISNADLAMYEAKSSGKNKLARYSQILAKEARRAKEVEACLKDLDMDKEMQLFFMPIVAADGSIDHCEALLRWDSATLGKVSPDEFIPIAETTGMFETIDFWVIEQAHKAFPQLQRIFGSRARLAINISSAQLSVDNFVERVIALSDGYQIPASKIEFEITETFAINADVHVQDMLMALQQSGYRVAIDDFGTGYTSLMQMVDYPVDKIKLDKVLINRITDPEKQAMLAPLIDLCHLQGLVVTAEGVETLEQQQALLDAGCDYLQGYLIAKPMHLKDLHSWAQGQASQHTTDSPLTSNLLLHETAKRH